MFVVVPYVNCDPEMQPAQNVGTAVLEMASDDDFVDLTVVAFADLEAASFAV